MTIDSTREEMLERLIETQYDNMDYKDLSKTEYLDSRQQMKDFIKDIIDANFGLVEYKDDVIEQLCEAVDIQFPLPD